MYIYEVRTAWYNEEDLDYVYGYSYVISDNKYSYEEFEELCNEAREVLGRDTWDISKYLIENYGFKTMPIETSFEYNPYEDEASQEE